MIKAFCPKCGIKIVGVWKGGPPKECPACGYSVHKKKTNGEK